MAEKKITKQTPPKTADKKKPDGRCNNRPTAEALNKAHAESPVIGDNGDKTPQDKIKHYMAFLEEIEDLPRIDTKNIEQLEQRFKKYKDLCQEYGIKPGNLNAYNALGIDKQVAYQWENRKAGNSPNETSGTELAYARCDFIKKVKRFCGAYREVLIANGQINPVTGIFWQKNYDGLTDAQEVVVTSNTSDITGKTAAEIAAERKARLGIDE